MLESRFRSQRVFFGDLPLAAVFGSEISNNLLF